MKEIQRGLMWPLKVLFFLFFIFSLLYIQAVATKAASCFAKIAFVANLDGNWDLFTVDEDGQNLVRLTKTPYDESEPCWSQDRQKIVYSTSEGRLYIVNVASKEHYELAIKGDSIKSTSPSFSPDSKKVVYVRFKSKATDDTELALFELDKEIWRSFLDQYSPQFFPSWSPDGKYIVYTNVHCSMDCGRIIQELWIVSVKGNYARQLLMTNSHCIKPVWSPDGKRIAFCSDKSGNFDIWLLSLNNGNVEQLTTNPNLDTCPAWSPDGRKVAFVSTRTGNMKIWIKNLETGNSTPFSPFENKDIECRDVTW